MELTINYQQHFFTEAPASLADLMHLQLPDQHSGIAVALNQQVIPKDAWPHTVLRPQDAILIITASQGG